MSMSQTARLVGVCVAFFAALPLVAAAQSAPFANTLGPDFITEQSARLNGRVNPGQMADTYYWFEWSFAGKSQTYPTKKIRMGSAMRDVRETIVGLAPNTTYCYVVVAENSRGKDVGQLSCFTTKKLSETIDPESRALTLGTKSLLANSVTFRGYVAPHGATASYWFEYGTSPMLGAITRTADKNRTSGFVEISTTNLLPKTTYYYRIVSEAAGVRWSGEVRSFTTLEGSAPTGTGVPPTSGGSPAAPYVMQVVRESVTGNTALIRYSWDVTGGGRGDGKLGVFTIEYGPTRSLGQKTVYSEMKRSARGSTTVRIPIYEGGVYHRGTFTSPTVSYTGAISYTKEEEYARSTSSRAATTSLRSSSPIGATIPSLSTRRATGTTDRTGSPGLLSRLFPSSGASQRKTQDDVTLLQSTTGSRKPQEPIEYTIRYANDTGKAMTDAVLSVIFPKNVIYIGDNTNNEFMVEEDPETGERTYILPIGLLSPGESRTITMMGMMTLDMDTDPSVRTRITYTDPSGQERLIFGDTVSMEDIERHEKGEDVDVADGQKDKKPGFFSRLFGGEEAFTPKDDATVLHAADGSQETGSLVTYTVRYANETGETMTDARLRFRLPKGVEYVGDSTDGEVTVEEDPVTGEKVYTLPVGTLEPGEGRTITVTGRNTEGTSAYAEIETEMVYTDENGEKKRVEGTSATLDEIRENERETPRAAVSVTESKDDGWRVFPTTIPGWLTLIVILAAIILGWNRARAWYLKKKKELEEEEKFRSNGTPA